ncbi:MAG: rod shape-determining protein [Planctomycetaceae bacterium]|nr:rod shape-determining protein [Planctomycetaceae bacterium]
MSKDIIAIDFGTTNTYIARCPANARTPSAIQFNSNSIGIETVLLYTNESAEESPYVGEQAVNGFGESTADERRKYAYQFCSHFKPDIVTDNRARRNAIDFLIAILRDARKCNINFSPIDCRVIVGVPSEASAGYRDMLRAIFREAGYGEADLIDEPIGAMLDSISSGLFSIADIISGFLVIDFGGGTCDFAFIKNGRVLHSWGEMNLGGRLFDDLFYRWFCDLNPGKEVELSRSGEDFFVRVYHCRQLKERFSQFTAMNPKKDFSCSIGNYGKIKGITWDEFVERARNYTPTESFMKFLSESNVSLSEKLSAGKTVDLLQWFQDSLMSGLSNAGIAISDIHVIALAGGSCQWSFVGGFCREFLNNEKFFRSNQPYATIAMGLAVLPALESEFQRKQKELTEALPSFERKIGGEIKQELNNGRDRIVSRIAVDLFDSKIRPILVSFRESGGKISELEADISREAKAFEVNIDRLVNDEIGDSLSVLFSMVLENVRGWLKGKDLRLGDVQNDTIFKAGKVNIGRVDPKVAESIVGVANMIVGLITTIIVANICGGGGTALVMTGPLGLVIGGIIGVAIGILAVSVGKEKATETAKNFTIPSNISPLPFAKINPLNTFLTDKRIAACREELQKNLSKEIDKALQGIMSEILQKVDVIIRNEISALSIANIK